MSTIRSRLASEGGKTPDSPGAAKLRILLIGSGGREHALTWRLEQSDLVDQIFVAPGNGGTALGLKTVNVNVPIDAFDDLADFATGANVGVAMCESTVFARARSGSIARASHDCLRVAARPPLPAVRS